MHCCSGRPRGTVCRIRFTLLGRHPEQAQDECRCPPSNFDDFAHKFSTLVVREKNTIACEALDLKGMPKTKLAKSVHDAARRETFRQVEYKAGWRARNFVFIDRWHPSSRLCSSCGYGHQELSPADRFWKCPARGVAMIEIITRRKTSETKD
jgi:transposase